MPLRISSKPAERTQPKGPSGMIGCVLSADDQADGVSIHVSIESASSLGPETYELAASLGGVFKTSRCAGMATALVRLCFA
jgi:hypothetical protein